MLVELLPQLKRKRKCSTRWKSTEHSDVIGDAKLSGRRAGGHYRARVCRVGDITKALCTRLSPSTVKELHYVIGARSNPRASLVGECVKWSARSAD
jgi:hypothetical protein